MKTTTIITTEEFEADGPQTTTSIGYGRTTSDTVGDVLANAMLGHEWKLPCPVHALAVALDAVLDGVSERRMQAEDGLTMALHRAVSAYCQDPRHQPGPGGRP